MAQWSKDDNFKPLNQKPKTTSNMSDDLLIPIILPVDNDDVYVCMQFVQKMPPSLFCRSFGVSDIHTDAII